jgi:hypothetical protein
VKDGHNEMDRSLILLLLFVFSVVKKRECHQAHVVCCGIGYWRIVDRRTDTMNGPSNISVWIQPKLHKAMQDFAAVQACRG